MGTAASVATFGSQGAACNDSAAAADSWLLSEVAVVRGAADGTFASTLVVLPVLTVFAALRLGQASAGNRAALTGCSGGVERHALIVLTLLVFADLMLLPFAAQLAELYFGVLLFAARLAELPELCLDVFSVIGRIVWPGFVWPLMVLSFAGTSVEAVALFPVVILSAGRTLSFTVCQPPLSDSIWVSSCSVVTDKAALLAFVRFLRRLLSPL